MRIARWVPPGSDLSIEDLWFYARAYAPWNVPAWADAAPTAEVIARARQLPRGRALDLGAGFGRDTLALARLGFDVTGLDRSRRAVRSARRAARGLDSSKVRFVTGRLSSFRSRERFDLVIDVLGPLSDLEPSLRAAAFEHLSGLTSATARVLVVTFDPNELVRAARPFFGLAAQRELSATPGALVWLELVRVSDGSRARRD
ncbi:MAG: methyltransferase domain-containing protein [Deltaproteobacteria bacterium]|nr:methyltransferase domain-containing protein [Deltaproteobacteria bacterium]